MLDPKLERILNQLLESARLKHDTARAKRDIATDIGRFPRGIRQIMFARHGQHGGDDRELGHVLRAHLRVDHHRAAGGKITHLARFRQRQGYRQGGADPRLLSPVSATTGRRGQPQGEWRRQKTVGSEG